MKPVAIVTDTACDLSPELARQYRVRLVPLVVRFGDKEYRDNQLSRDAYWKHVQGEGLEPQTSQPAPGWFEEAFRELIERGFHVLCMGVTSRHSGTLNSANVAAQLFPGQVTLFDTLSLSLPQGYMVIEAGRLAMGGATLEEIIARLESVRARSRLTIMLETIENIKKGGRIGGLIPVLDRLVRALSIKPLLKVEEGELKIEGAVRTRSKAFRRMVDSAKAMVRGSLSGAVEAVFVPHVREPQAAEELADLLAQALGFPREQVWVGEAGPVLATHAGPGVVAAGLVLK